MAGRSKRALWLHEMFKGLYFSEKLGEAKNAIEYRYESQLQSLLERRMNDRHTGTDDSEVLTLTKLDDLLNYIEHVLGFEKLGLLDREERKIIFDYWPNIIGADPKLAALRRYIAMCGYELIIAELGLENVDYLAVYGSLMKGLNPSHQPDFMEYLDYVGEVRIPGTLYEVREDNSYPYPGLKLTVEPETRLLHPTRRSVRLAERRAERIAAAAVGELYRVRDATVFELLDKWEGYDATEPVGSPYIRQILRMVDPEVDAWVYVGNHADTSHIIAETSWRDHLAQEDHPPDGE